MKQRVREVVRIYWYHVSEVHEDMLRYDCAFANEEFPNVVAFPEFKEKGQGRWGGIPTTARWASFGIAIRAIREPERQNILTAPEKWYTVRHGRGLENDQKVTLPEYLRPTWEDKWH